ncbi:MAG: hypothetical protein EBZ03_10150 [Betaproteobacteria bacterium]|nr:hypothetical protein [Betaproteobacteria bacterium]NBO44949.1 hypothetical protein [Betaproteobacteria bacterium]NBP10609.1 hypothetical protein [Betaproteobacteria bacterium]NBP62360.1 hypothetical protein [Betaproteobacteria bacterium]NBQ09024.1 hypothetical protein [Betaproteobacteria bacterium]
MWIGLKTCFDRLALLLQGCVFGIFWRACSRALSLGRRRRHSPWHAARRLGSGGFFRRARLLPAERLF